MLSCAAPAADRLLRPGGITPEQLRQALGQLEIDPAVTGQ